MHTAGVLDLCSLLFFAGNRYIVMILMAGTQQVAATESQGKADD
jgi:hypothetical protein